MRDCSCDVVPVIECKFTGNGSRCAFSLSFLFVGVSICLGCIVQMCTCFEHWAKAFAMRVPRAACDFRALLEPMAVLVGDKKEPNPVRGLKVAMSLIFLEITVVGGGKWLFDNLVHMCSKSRGSNGFSCSKFVS